jgi:tetratricopeptide (TPR) repeat protein
MKASLALALLLTVAGIPIAGQAPLVDRAKASRTELDQGQLLIEHREYFEGLKRLRRASELSGNTCAECLVSILEAMNGMKAYQNTIDAAPAALSVAAGTPRLLGQAYTFRGAAYVALGDKDPTKYAPAEADFRAALAADPGSHVTDDLHFNLGIVLLKEKRDAEGVAELKQAVAIRPDSFMADDAKRYIANPRRARENYAPDFDVKTPDNQHLTLESLHGRRY